MVLWVMPWLQVSGTPSYIQSNQGQKKDHGCPASRCMLSRPQSQGKRVDTESSETRPQESNQEGAPAGSSRGSEADAQQVGIWDNWHFLSCSVGVPWVTRTGIFLDFSFNEGMQTLYHNIFYQGEVLWGRSPCPYSGETLLCLREVGKLCCHLSKHDPLRLHAEQHPLAKKAECLIFFKTEERPCWC